MENEIEWNRDLILAKLRTKECTASPNTKKSTSEVWNYFQHVEYYDKKTGFVVCCHCNSYAIKYVPKQGTKGLLQHMKKCQLQPHLKDHFFPSASGMLPMKKKTPLKQSNASNSLANSTSQQPFKTKLQISKQVNEAIVDLCLNEFLPFEIATSNGFLHYTHKIMRIGRNFGLLKNEEIAMQPLEIGQTITRMYEHILPKLKQELHGCYSSFAGCCGLAFSFDSWQNKQTKQSYVALLVHYEKQGKLFCRVLAVEQWGMSSMESPIQQLVAVMDFVWGFYDIPGNNFAKTIVTSIGSSMDFAKYFTPESSQCVFLPSTSHQFESVCDAAMRDDGLIATTLYSIDTCREIGAFLQATEELPQISDLLNKELSSRSYALPVVLKLVVENRELINKGLCQNYSALAGKMQSIEWNILLDIVKIMEPIRELLEFVQSPRKPTFPFVLCAERLWFENMQVSEGDKLSLEVGNFKEVLRKNSQRLLDFSSNFEYKVGEFFVPYLKNFQISSVENKENIKNYLLDKVEKVEFRAAFKRAKDAEQKGKPCSIANEPPKKKSKLNFSSIMHTLQQNTEEHCESIGDEDENKAAFQIEFFKYCSQKISLGDFFTCDLEEVNPLHGNIVNWWKSYENEYPILSSIAKFYLALPACSGKIEQTFIPDGSIFALEQSTLDPKNVKKMVICRSNVDL